VVATGNAAALPPLAALTAYRIVQEALTNVVRHAPGAEAAVHVDISQAGLRIQVTNTGRTAGSPDLHGRGEGHGVVGMRERAATFGGTVDAAPLPQGGFKVMAFLPVTASTAERVA
jgi:signal transduction histidine kinase